MKIYAPVKDFDGLRNNIRFVRGVGETNDPKLIEWFETHGYTIETNDVVVEKCDETIVPTIEKCDGTAPLDAVEDNEPDLDTMTPNELREWMKENGYGFKMKNIRSKEKLLEIIRG